MEYGYVEKNRSIVTKAGIKAPGEKIYKKDCQNFEKLVDIGWITYPEEKNFMELFEDNEEDIIDVIELTEEKDKKIFGVFKNDKPDYSELTKKELIEIAKSKNIEFDIRMKKAEILELIVNES